MQFGKSTPHVSKIMNNYHSPVLVAETVEALNIQKGKKYIDATIGGGGHGVKIIKRGGILLGLDVDGEAIEETKRIFNFQFPIFKEGRDWNIVQGNFRDIERIAKENGFEEVSGVLFDFGVSSHQLDTPARGFSYRFTDAAVDLRLNQNEGESAATLLAHVSREELYEILATFGEEERAGATADAIVRSRRVKPIATSGELAAIVGSVVPAPIRESTLSRVYQAIRIAVNDELTAMRAGLIGAKNLLVPGGRLVAISFHSLEDRIVKMFLRQAKMGIITKVPITASQGELQKNRRARSAKMRVAEKI